MANQLPVSRIVNVSVILTPAGAQAQSLSDMLILGTSTVIDTVEQSRTYATLAAVAADFGTTAPEYLAAQLWFGQSPQPTRVIIGRWYKTAASGGLRCGILTTAQQAMSVWNAITNGQFKLAKDGGTVTNYGPLNFSAAANLPAVAAIIQAALTGITVTWNAVLSRFEFTSSTTGATSAVSFLTAGTANDISTTLAGTASSSGAYTFTGAALETPVTAITRYDNAIGRNWYGVYIIGAATDADTIAAAAYIQGANTKHTLWVTSQDAGCLSAVTTSDIAYALKQLGYNRTFVQYSSQNPYAALSAAARLLTTNFNANNTVITLKFKQEPGVVYENLTSTQADAAAGKSANVFVQYDNNTAILQEGVMADGTFADIINGADWLAVTAQTALYNLLYTSTTKIPQTDQGQQLLCNAVEAVCQQGVTNGLLAPGVWQSGGFGTLQQNDFLSKGYYVYSASFSTQSISNRTARRAMPIQVAAKLAGAVHFVDCIININQ